jgi:hypothetical protein
MPSPFNLGIGFVSALKKRTISRYTKLKAQSSKLKAQSSKLKAQSVWEKEMENSTLADGNNKVYYKSRLAYIRPVLGLIVFSFLGVFLALGKYTATTYLGCGIILYAVLSFIAEVIHLKTLKLYITDEGVYLFSGILPWKKGITGTTWRDIADANYYPGFISWATKSYKIIISHRFTKSSELVIPHIKDGNDAVITINSIINHKYQNMP